MGFRRAVLEMKRAHTLGGGYGQAHGGGGTIPLQATAMAAPGAGSGIAINPVKFGASDFGVSEGRQMTKTAGFDGGEAFCLPCSGWRGRPVGM
jgi:hypothetical protein